METDRKRENIMTTNALEIARNHLARGWQPIPIPYKSKEPKLKSWQKRTITAENVADYFNGGQQNNGVQLGPRSNGLADVDLDCPEAIQLARYFLPPTEAMFGRPSKPNSHSLYYIKDAPPTESSCGLAATRRVPRPSSLVARMNPAS